MQLLQTIMPQLSENGIKNLIKIKKKHISHLSYVSQKILLIKISIIPINKLKTPFCYTTFTD